MRRAGFGRRTLACLLGIILGAPGAFAEAKPLQLKWSEIIAFVGHNKIELTLRDGTVVSGEAVTTRDDSLVMSVSGSTSVGPYTSGSAAVPRQEIASIKVKRGRGTFGRSMGLAVGVISGLGLGGYAGGHANSAGAALSIFVAITAGAAVSGALLGRKLDQRVTLVVIVP